MGHGTRGKSQGGAGSLVFFLFLLSSPKRTLSTICRLPMLSKSIVAVNQRHMSLPKDTFQKGPMTRSAITAAKLSVSFSPLIFSHFVALSQFILVPLEFKVLFSRSCRRCRA